MKRRDIIRQLFLGAFTAKAVMADGRKRTVYDEIDFADTETEFHSAWHLLQDMTWVGETLWAQRLQDWCIKDGELNCLVHGADRTINLLTHQLSAEDREFSCEAVLRFSKDAKTDLKPTEHFAGFRLGLKGRFEDYRSAIFTGKGIDAGIGRNGKLFIGKK